MAMTAVEAVMKIPSQVLAAVIDAEDQLSMEEVTQKLMNDWHVPPFGKCIVRRRVADVRGVQARRKLKEFGLEPMPEDARGKRCRYGGLRRLVRMRTLTIKLPVLVYNYEDSR